MAKTRSQTGNITIKKEEEEEDCKRTLGLNSVTITKRKPSKRNNRRFPAQQVKVEDDSDTKALLKSTSNHSKLPKGQLISQEQINQLIDAIVNDNMSVPKAASTAKVSITTARNYYTDYKNDPERKIPLPRNQLMHPKTYYTQEQVENLIRYIVHDKMSVPQASAKVNMNDKSGRQYYNKYLKDPAHNIPVPKLCRRYTQDQKNELIGYIVNDKMTIAAASRKAKMAFSAGRYYCRNYFNRPLHPRISLSIHPQEKIMALIGYITEEKMTVRAASKKANMSVSTASRYYREYLNDSNHDVPTHITYNLPCTQEQVTTLIRCIVEDKMSVANASKKVNISKVTGYKYYYRLVRDHQ